MGRKVAMLWHATFSIGAGVLYFFFVLPRWHELMGDTTHSLGTAVRIVTGALVGLAALPVVFTLVRTRRPELGTPQLALSIRVWSIVAHVLAGVLIIGAAISEIWLSLDAAGQYLFAVYGAAAAIAMLGFFGFYLSFVAELPPPPPKPLKPKKPKKRRILGKKGDEADTEPAIEEAEAVDDTETERSRDRRSRSRRTRSFATRKRDRRSRAGGRTRVGHRGGACSPRRHPRHRRGAERIAQPPPDREGVASDAPAHPGRRRRRGIASCNQSRRRRRST